MTVNARGKTDGMYSLRKLKKFRIHLDKDNVGRLHRLIHMVEGKIQKYIFSLHVGYCVISYSNDLRFEPTNSRILDYLFYFRRYFASK